MASKSSKFTGIIVFFLLCGIYIVPENTRALCICVFVLRVMQFIYNRYLVFINTKQLVLWFLFILFGTSMSLLNGLNLNISLEFSIVIILGTLFGNTYMKEDVRKSIITAVVVVAMVVLLGCLLQFVAPDILSQITNVTLGTSKYYYFKDFLSYGALVGFSYQTGVTGYYLAVLAGFVFCVYLNIGRNKKSAKIFTLVIFCSIYLLILLTRKRSQLLAVLILVIFLYAIYNKKNVIKILVISSALLIGVILMLEYTTVGQTILNRSVGVNASLSGREYIYSVMIDNFKKRPLLGNGFGYTLKSVHKFTNGHNVYLQVLSENGIIGLGLYLGLLIMYLKQAYMLLKRTTKGGSMSRDSAFCLFIEGLFVLNGVFGNPLYDVFPVIVFLMVSGVVQSQLRDLE